MDGGDEPPFFIRSVAEMTEGDKPRRLLRWERGHRVIEGEGGSLEYISQYNELSEWAVIVAKTCLYGLFRRGSSS